MYGSCNAPLIVLFHPRGAIVRGAASNDLNKLERENAPEENKCYLGSEFTRTWKSYFSAYPSFGGSSEHGGIIMKL